MTRWIEKWKDRYLLCYNIWICVNLVEGVERQKRMWRSLRRRAMIRWYPDTMEMKVRIFLLFVFIILTLSAHGEPFIRQIFPQSLIPDSVKYKCTRWAQDPFACGSYSNYVVHSNSNTIKLLSRDRADGRVH